MAKIVKDSMTVMRLALVLCLLGFSLMRCDADLTDDYESVTWDGMLSYFAVPRQRVAEKLSQLKVDDSDSQSKGAGQLFLPTKSILPEDQHVVAVSFGRITVPSVDNGSDFSSVADTIQFFIPFLTAKDPDAIPLHKLTLASFASTDKPFANPNPCIPAESVDSITRLASGVRMEDGQDSLSMQYSISDECVVPDEGDDAVFEQYNLEYTLSFTACNQSCQYWTHDPLGECVVNDLQIVDITDKFEKLSLLLADDVPIKHILSITNEGNFQVRVKDPCFE